MTIMKKLKDLHKQATTEESHFYTATVIREAIDHIKNLTEERDRLKDKVDVSDAYKAYRY